MDATISNPITVLAKFVGKKTCELNSGERVEVELPKKIKSGQMVQLILEQGNYSFFGLVEKTVQAEEIKVQEKEIAVEKPYRFINFLSCGHSWILNRDEKIYSKLEKNNLMHLNWDGKCPSCGGKEIPQSELFRQNGAEQEKNIFSLIDKSIRKEQNKRDLKSLPNKTVFFECCSNYVWVNKNNIHYHDFENAQELPTEKCPIHGQDHKYGFGEIFFKLFNEDGKEL